MLPLLPDAAHHHPRSHRREHVLPVHPQHLRRRRRGAGITGFGFRFLHDDADDVLQNTFIKVFKSIDRFEQKSSLFTWLYRIATNETLSFLEQQKKYHYDTVDDHQEHPAIARLKADPYFDGDELRLKLEQVMQSLPEKQRMVFQLRYYEELSYKEIADILDTTEGALKVSYHHALKKVEDYFKSK